WAEIGVGRPFVHLSGRYPVERGCFAVVWPLAPHPTNKNELIVWDLASDPRELESLEAETVRRRLYTRADELPAGESRLPIKTIHVNKSPIVIGNLRVLGDAAARWSLDVDAAQANAVHAAALPPLDRLWADVFKRDASDAAVDVDEDLYGGFVGNEDRRALQRLRELAPAQLVTKRPAFHDGRLEELLFRYRARNFPDLIDGDDRERWQRYRVARLHEGEGGATTLPQYFNRIDTLAEKIGEGDERGAALLEALYDYAESIAPER
ncbi:MAG: exodeoxyribonuclease I, partial [Burkholderiales bacterium]|nr:exodeoxyribonuclease I [Burkholderiales bacterium]